MPSQEQERWIIFVTSRIIQISPLTTGSPSSLYEPHKQHNMASNYKGLYGIFYKISMEVVKSENSQ